MAAHLGSSRLSRRTLLQAAAMASAGLGLSATTADAATLGPANPVLANDVRQEFLTAWTAYRRLAWGHDELSPLSGTGSEFFIGGTPLGLTIIEALDTMYLMELDGEFAAGVDWITNNLSFDRNASVHVFEAIIRLVGGLLSGYHASGQAILLTRARDIADRLLPAFNSPTGAPYRFVNLRTGAVSGNQVPLAEVGSNITELGWLSQLTGDPKYFNAAKKALRAPFDRRSSLNLVGTTLNVDTGAWVDATARVDPPVDSYFEYLWDGFQFFGDNDLLSWYRTLTGAILQRLPDTGAVVGRTQAELTAFYAGLLGQGGNLPQGESYHSSWAAVLAQHRLPPEAIDYTTLAALSNQYQLRPEYVDSALFLWMLTGNEVYRTRAQDMWNRQKTHCKVANGYASVTNMTTTPTTKGDNTPAYWLSENMKYYYLMWAGSPRFDYVTNYLTTEGNVLRGIKRVAAPFASNTYRLANRASGRVLDVNGRSVADNAPIIVWDSTNGPNQRWIITTTGGLSRLTSLNSGKVVNVPGNSTGNGVAIVQLAHNGGNNQQWTLQPAGAFFVLVNRNSGKVLDTAGTANGSAVVQQPASGATSQQWQLIQS